MLPLVHCSLPRTWPYCLAAEVSQVAASLTGAGSWVAPLTPSATPAGPSCWVTSGTHSAGIAWVSPIAPLGASPLWPSIRSSLSASVIFASSIETRWLTGRLVFSHGQSATSPVVPASARSWTATPGARTRDGETPGRAGRASSPAARRSDATLSPRGRVGCRRRRSRRSQVSTEPPPRPRLGHAIVATWFSPYRGLRSRARATYPRHALPKPDMWAPEQPALASQRRHTRARSRLPGSASGSAGSGHGPTVRTQRRDLVALAPAGQLLASEDPVARSPDHHRASSDAERLTCQLLVGSCVDARWRGITGLDRAGRGDPWYATAACRDLATSCARL